MKRIRTIVIISIIIVTLFTLAGCPALFNKPPELEIPDYTINEGETLNINLDNYSSDEDGDKLTYSIISGVGNIQENTYTYTPDYDESGTHDVVIKAEDNKGGEVQDSFIIEVININATPSLNIPDQQMVEGETLTLDLLDYTTDPDATDTFSYTLLSGVGSITDNIYTYTATYTDEGTKTVTIKVENDEGASSEDTFIIIIGNINLPPKAEINFTPTNPEEGEKVHFDASNSTDEKDGPETLQTRWDFNGDGEWEIRYDEEIFADEEVTCTFNNAGSFSVILEIKDSDGATDLAQKTVDINLAQPSSPYISEVEENNVTINWTDNSNSEDGYKIYVDEVYKTEVNANIETASFDIDTSATRTIKIICYKGAFESLPTEIVLGKQKEVVTKYKEVFITIPASHLGKKVTLETVEDPPDLPEGSDSISKAYNIVVEDIPDDATSTPIGINFESVFEKMEEADFNKTENADVPVILHYEDETGTWIPLYTVIDNDGNYTTYTKDFSTFELVLVDPNSNMFNQLVKDYSVKTYGLKFRNFGTNGPIFDVGDNFYPVDNNNGGHCYGMVVTSLGAFKEKLGFVDPFFDAKCPTPKFIIHKHSYMDYRLSCTPIIEFVGYEQQAQFLPKLTSIPDEYKTNIQNANDIYSLLLEENTPIVLHLIKHVEDVDDEDDDGNTTEIITKKHAVLAYGIKIEESEPSYNGCFIDIYDPNYPDQFRQIRLMNGHFVDDYKDWQILVCDDFSTKSRPKRQDILEDTLEESYSPWLKDIYYYINDNVCKVFWWNFCRPDKTEPSTQYIERKDDDKFEIINTINDMSTNYFNDYNVQTNKKYEYIVSRSDGKSSPSMAVYTQYFETLPSSGSTVNNEGFTVVFPQFEGIKVMIYSFYFEDGEWKSLKSNSDFDNVIEFDQDDCKKLFSNTESRLIRFAKRNINNNTYSVRDVVFYGVDNIPPTVTKVSGPSGTIEESSSTFEWSGNDPDGEIEKYEYRKDGGGWEDNGLSTTFEWSEYSEGSHTFEVRAKDDEGDYSDIISWSFTYEPPNQPPTVTKISGPAGTIEASSSTFEWSGNDPDGTIDHYEYRKDGSSWVNYGTNESFTWNGYTEGEHTFEVRAEDNDGAYSTIITWTFIYESSNILFSEDFETGDFSAHEWVLGGYEKPVVQSDEVYEGNYAVQFIGGVTEENQWCRLEIEVNLENDSVISFYRKLNGNYLDEHYFWFEIDRNLAGLWMGDAQWQEVVREVPAGTHTLTWHFASSSSELKAFVDNIEIVEDMDLGDVVNIPDANLKANILAFLGKYPVNFPIQSQAFSEDFKQGTKYVEVREIFDNFEEADKNNIDTQEYNNQKVHEKELEDFTIFGPILDVGGICNLIGIEYMSNLKYLILSGDDNSEKKISNITPLENMTNLDYLNLGNNQITDISPLENMTNLDYLNLGNNQITDISPLENMTKLEMLYLANNQITDISPLENMTNLDFLDLWNNQITDISPLENMTKLEMLYLANNQITDISPLENMTNLWRLVLENNQITDISPLENMTELRYLFLNFNNIENIKPLVKNTGINSGDLVYITHNYLDISAGSEDMEDINTLIDRGVNVYYDPQK